MPLFMGMDLCHTRYSQSDIARIASAVSWNAVVEDSIRARRAEIVLDARNGAFVGGAHFDASPRCGRQVGVLFQAAHPDLGIASKPALLDHRDMPVER